MDVLLIGADNPVGEALHNAFSEWGRHNAVTVTSAASRWRSERQAKKVVRRGSPEAVVDLRLAWQLTAGEELQAIDVERSHWLAKACARSEMLYLLVSSDVVFSGHTGRSLRENDDPDAQSASGTLLAEAERRVLHALPSALVLRTGPLISSSGNNLLTRTLDAMCGETPLCSSGGGESGAGESGGGEEARGDPHPVEAGRGGAACDAMVPGGRNAIFDDQQLICPVATVDAARVLCAMLDQLSAGAECAGIFHYCSGDKTTRYGLAEAALAAAGQFSDCSDVLISPDESARARELHVLDCTRLRDSFAIKQLPWRNFINSMVSQYFQRLAVK